MTIKKKIGGTSQRYQKEYHDAAVFSLFYELDAQYQIRAQIEGFIQYSTGSLIKERKACMIARQRLLDLLCCVIVWTKPAHNEPSATGVWVTLCIMPSPTALIEMSFINSTSVARYLPLSGCPLYSVIHYLERSALQGPKTRNELHQKLPRNSSNIISSIIYLTCRGEMPAARRTGPIGSHLGVCRDGAFH
jgi:hypothetical protein